MSSFATQLKKFRIRYGLKQAELARILGLAQTTIANYEQGNRFPNETMLNRLADFFRIGTDVLLGRVSEERAQIGSAVTQDGHRPGLGPRNAAILSLLIHNRAAEAPAAIDELRSSGWSVQSVYLEIIEPILTEVGARWERGLLDVYQEHQVSAIIQSIMAKLAPLPAQEEHGRSRFLCFAVSGELHTIGLQMVCDLLGSAGRHTLFLGSSLPPSSMLRAIREFKPQVIGISACLLRHVGIVEQTIHLIRSTTKVADEGDKPLIVVGGRAFQGSDSQWSRIGADGSAGNAREAVELITSLSPDPPEQTGPPGTTG